jgi:phage baseplate assembly protein gpV
MSVDEKLPRGAILGAGFLVVSSLLMVGIARLTGYTPAQPPASTVVESYDIRFEDRPDGAVLIYDSSDNQLTVSSAASCAVLCAKAAPTASGPRLPSV